MICIANTMICISRWFVLGLEGMEKGMGGTGMD